MTEFKTQEFPKENRHCLQFETDNRDYFLKVQAAAQESIDHKPLTNFERIKAMTVEEMAGMIFNEANNGYYYCNYCSYQSFYAPHCTAVETAQSCKKAIAKWLESEVQEE